MYPKALIAILLVLLCFASCKKDNSDTDIYPDKIVLNPIKVFGNMATISWSKLSIPLLEYELVRVTDTTISLYTYNNYKFILVDKNTNTYTDTLPYTAYAQYYIVATLAATNSSGANSYLSSNPQTCSRTDMDFMNFQPMDAIIDRDNNRLFVYDSIGNIAQYDLQTQRITKRVFTNAASGYCTLGNNNGIEELYIPRSDGWLFIYDATTLVKTDQIYIGSPLMDVAYDNGILYVVAKTSVVSYNRPTKQVISNCPSTGPMVLKKVPGTNTQLIGISYDGNYGYHFYYNNGQFNKVTIGYQSVETACGSIFEIFPDGNKFISSSSGYIYDSSLASIGNLPFTGIEYPCFDFDNTNRLIYAGCDQKMIQVFSMDSYQLSRTFNTKGYPQKIFYINGKLFSISTTFSSYAPIYQSFYYYTPYGSTFLESL